MKYFSYYKKFSSLEAATYELSVLDEALRPLQGVKNLEELVSSNGVILSMCWNEQEWEASGYSPDGSLYFSLVGEYEGESVGAYYAYYGLRERRLPDGWEPIVISGEATLLARIAIERDTRELPFLKWGYEGVNVSFYADIDPLSSLAAIAEEENEMVLGAILAMSVTELRHRHFSSWRVPEEEMARLRTYVLAWRHAMQAIACACAEKLGIQAQDSAILWASPETFVSQDDFWVVEG